MHALVRTGGHGRSIVRCRVGEYAGSHSGSASARILRLRASPFVSSLFAASDPTQEAGSSAMGGKGLKGRTSTTVFVLRQNRRYLAVAVIEYSVFVLIPDNVISSVGGSWQEVDAVGPAHNGQLLGKVKAKGTE